MKLTWAGCAAVLTLACSVVSADVILGNYPPANNTTLTADVDNLRRKAMSFAMPAGSDYFITSITLRLGNYITPGDSAVLEIRNHTGSTTAPGLTTIGAFVAPASASSAISDFVFTPVGTVTLQAGTSYWIYLSGANSTTSFDWRGSSPAIIPTGIAAYGGQSLFTTNGGTSWTSSATINSFLIEGDIPAPAAGALLLLAGVVARRRARGALDDR
jgi:hypothetical protein